MTNARLDFEALPLALQRRILHARLLAKGFPAEFDLIERLRLHPNTRMSLFRGVLISRNAAGKITETAAQATGAGAHFNNSGKRIALDERVGKASFGGMKFSWRLESRKGAQSLKFVPGTELFDAEQVGTSVILRHWQRGDRFQPIGMDRAVKLQDLFVNQKVPRERRHALVLATTATGDIFWVEGLRIAERFKLTGGTKRRLRWSWRRA
jgi:tRNA(Ile)-lysidine synthetase-like protein